MNYETFLFTRNKRRDFTAFVRPAEMTNKEVSLLASAFNNITDVAALTRERPSLYCFALGAHIFVLRHYDSGRTHAGREIGVIEGIAVRREQAAALATLLPDILARQDEMLDFAGRIDDIEQIEVIKSPVMEWDALTPDWLGTTPVNTVPSQSFSPSGRGEEESSPDEIDTALAPADSAEMPDEDANDEVNTNAGESENEEEDGFGKNDADEVQVDLPADFAARLADGQLMLPFTDEGRALLIAAARARESGPLRFAFGANPDVIARLADGGVTFDTLGLFGTAEVAFRERAGLRPAAVLAGERVEATPLTPRETLAEATETAATAERRHRSLIGRLVGWLLGR